MGFFSFLTRKPADGYPELSAPLWDGVRSGRPALAALDDAGVSRLRRLSSWFLAVKEFVPIGGAAPDGLDEATIAVLACLPIVWLGPAWYDDWTTVLVAPAGFVHSMVDVDGAGVVTEYDDELSGRVTEMGPVLLSLADVRDSGRGDGYNVVIHEMAHKLDGRDGALDGCPPLPRSMSRAAWAAAFAAAYGDFLGRVGRGGRGGRRSRASRLPLDEYAADSPEEFFAVSCEAFFDTPHRLRDAYPEVFGLLTGFFASNAQSIR
jgi:Mlc titration factor MtfA (ptsG expression regulator)